MRWILLSLKNYNIQCVSSFRAVAQILSSWISLPMRNLCTLTSLTVSSYWIFSKITSALTLSFLQVSLETHWKPANFAANLGRDSSYTIKFSCRSRSRLYTGPNCKQFSCIRFKTNRLAVNSNFLVKDCIIQWNFKENFSCKIGFIVH